MAYDGAEYEDWSFSEQEIWDKITDQYPELAGDREAETLYHLGYFAEDIAARDRDEIVAELHDYLNEEYDLDWDQVFDWEDYRDWYDAQ